MTQFCETLTIGQRVLAGNGHSGTVRNGPDCDGYFVVKLDAKPGQETGVDDFWRGLPLHFRPALDAPKGEEPESWHGFKRGDRVRHKDWPCGGKVLGPSALPALAATCLECLRDDGRTDSTIVYPGSLERLAPPQPLGDGDRLHDGGRQRDGATCCLCGGARDWFRGDGPAIGYNYCIPCKERLGGTAGIDAEITRRLALQKAATVPVLDRGGLVEKCGDCGKPIDDICNAVKRTRVVNGRKEMVPGSFHVKCATERCPSCSLTGQHSPLCRPCAHCGERFEHSDPERLTCSSSCEAWRMRKERLAASEAKEARLEDRRKEYAKQRDDNVDSHRANPAVYAEVSGKVLDRAIARVRAERKAQALVELERTVKPRYPSVDSGCNWED